MSRWAVFDVDGTLFPPSSMEKTFISHMLKKGAIPAVNIFYYFLTGCIRMILTNYAEGFKNNKYYLKYLPARPIQSAARQFVQQFIWPRISSTGKEQIRLCRQNGYRILIMSGSPDFLTYPLAAYLQPDLTIAADLEIKENQFSGELSGLHPYGERKTFILKELSKKYGIDFQNSMVFANHHSDFHHMELFGKAIAVNPTAKLKKLAEKEGWKIDSWG
jgi:HAD superfamily phosphoserine phosphatase-like hydrolase